MLFVLIVAVVCMLLAGARLSGPASLKPRTIVTLFVVGCVILTALVLV